MASLRIKDLLEELQSLEIRYLEKEVVFEVVGEGLASFEYIEKNLDTITILLTSDGNPKG